MPKNMGFHLIWLFLFWPMWMLSTDPQSSPPVKVKDVAAVLEDSIPTLVKSEPAKPEQAAEKDAVPGSGSYSPPPDEKDEKREAERENLTPEFSDSGAEYSGGGLNIPEPSHGFNFQEETKTDENRLDSQLGGKGDEILSQIAEVPSQEQVTEKTETFVTPQMETIPGSIPAAEEPFPPQHQEPAGTTEIDENTTATGKTEEIPSFSEWTKLQLSKKPDQSILLQPNGVVREIKKEDGKNFASPDCGAKILIANPEAQNPSGTISSSHDEYMLNRCGVSSWLIMELCEPIRIEKIVIGNLELFSSSPKEIDVGVSDRYPTREWLKIGPLELPDARAAHAFPVNTNSTYSKFIRIQILSHHGNEHYCPLSVIRIYGKSEYEVLDQAEASHSEEVVHSESDSAVGEEPVNNEGTNEKSVIGTAADAVISIVKKAAQVLGKRGPSSDSSNKTNCQSVASCLSPTPNVTDVCNRKLLYFVQANSNYFTNNASCRGLLNNKSIGTPSQVEGFWVALFGEGILHSVCKYMSPLRGCDDQEPDTVEETVKAFNGNTTLKSNLTAELAQATTQQPNNEIPQTPAPEINTATEKPPPQPVPVVVVEEESRIQKESVFVRLTNRIKALERNQSLSSGYLEELSQRFKKQSEESYSVSQSMKKSLNETNSKYIWLQEFSRRESSFLKRSVADLRVTLWRTEMQRGFLIFVVLLQFIGIAFFCCWTRRRLSDLEEKINSTVRSVSAPVVPPPRKESQLPILPRKRSNSHPDILKLKKKKKKKDAWKNPSENVFLFNMPHSATSPDSIGTESKPISPNGNLPNSQITPVATTPKYEVDAVTVNRFGLLASPSIQTLNSVGSGVSSTNSNEGLSNKKLLVESNAPVATNGHKSAGSASSLDSTSGKSIKGSKKKSKLNLISKFFEK